MKKTLLLLTLITALLHLRVAAAPADPLADGFANPPEQTAPWCYWYWISDNISKDGITKDLEAMKQFGIGEALIGNIWQDKVKAGPVKVFSEEWWDLTRHAFREGTRLGVNVGLFNCPGWSQSGGPWIKPTQTMRYLASSETRVTGPRRFAEVLPAPDKEFQQVAVLAFPAPAADLDTLSAQSPQVVCSPEASGAEKLVDGDANTFFEFPAAAGQGREPFTIEFTVGKPFTARSLAITPAAQEFNAAAELAALDSTGEWRVIRRFKCDRSNMGNSIGPMPRGPVQVAFPPVTAEKFRVSFTGVKSRAKTAALAEISLAGAARLEFYVEKQLGKMHPTPLPLWDAYLWPAPGEPESPQFAVAPAAVRDLTAQVGADGMLRWDVPPGEWIILRTGMTPTGVRNGPAAPEAVGLEVDKMNRKLSQVHFDAFVGEVLKRVPAAERESFKRIVADSYETGSQNWTDGLEKLFRKQYGYDPKPWLPVLTGRLVGSADQSERFLWDLRRLVADLVAVDYVGGLRDAAKAHGLGLWLENYGHWGFPGEFLNYGGEADRIGGEFWVTGDLGSIECRAASSCANTYGKQFVSAESFTGGPPFQTAPADMKARGDWSLCEGINHRVLHVYIQQPKDGKPPGINAPWGTEFNRLNTWFADGQAWVDYEQRCSWMLQQGWRVADAAYFIGEDTPKMTGVRDPELPPGRDFDYINAEVIEKNLTVKNGRLTLPHGVSYRLLVLPKQKTMRPGVLRKIAELVKAGATVYGEPPVKSPSLANFSKSDREVQTLAAEIWGAEKLAASGERAFGKGRVVWGKPLAEVFAALQLPPDIEYRGTAADAKFLFTHRSSPEAEIYFVSNQKDRTEALDVAFRVVGRQPELWDAVTGERRALPEWSEAAGQTVVPLEFAANQSWFVVFRQAAKPVATGAKNFPALKTAATLDGAWDVAFDPQWGGPEKVGFATLSDWTKHAEDGIKHYSGKAVYRKTFDAPSSADKAARVWLDLGEVRDLAVVRLNGRTLATVWTAPWRVDVTEVLKQTGNQLEIEIINVWNNRIVGDLALPEAQRRTALAFDSVKSSAPLMPAGLLGPVTLKTFNGN